mgnify:CR=1 FL=1|jgi:hypothetical protein
MKIKENITPFYSDTSLYEEVVQGRVRLGDLVDPSTVEELNKSIYMLQCLEDALLNANIMMEV